MYTTKLSDRHATSRAITHVYHVTKSLQIVISLPTISNTTLSKQRQLINQSTTMSYYAKGHRADEDEVDDFDEYDPTPYGGGYDLHLTYGRPLPPSDEICYPKDSFTSDSFDYDRPQYTSHAEPSAYADEVLDNEYTSYARPKPRPGSTRPGYGGGVSEFGGSEYGSGGGYGRKPEYERPESGGGYGRKSEYEEPSEEYGTGYGRKPEFEEPSEEHGSGYGRKPEYEEPSEEGYGRRPGYEKPSSEFGSGYGRKPAYEEPSSEYGSGYGRKPGYEQHESGYGRKPEYEQPDSEYGSGYGRKPAYEEPESGYGRKPEYERPNPEFGSGYGRKPEYERPASKFGSGYGRESESEEYGSGGYGGRPERAEFEAPSYGRTEEGEYRKPSYERREDDDEEENEGYGRKKYVCELTIYCFKFHYPFLVNAAKMCHCCRISFFCMLTLLSVCVYVLTIYVIVSVDALVILVLSSLVSRGGIYIDIDFTKV